MIAVIVHNAHPRFSLSPQGPKRLVRSVFRREGHRSGSVSVVVTDDRLIRRINRRYLGHDRPTDVISFPLNEGGRVEGEIYVNIDKAARQARTFHEALECEIARLIIHGALHLLGYDDRKATPARAMKRREDRYVERLATKDTVPT